MRSIQRELEAGEGVAGRGVVRRSLMRLKQTWNHPSQLTGDGDYPAGDGGKFVRLAEICVGLADLHERALVCTQ